MAIDPKTGWADNRLMDAYDLVFEIWGEISSEEDCYVVIEQALDAIENADVALGRR